MKKTSIKHRQTGSRLIKILSAVLIPFILLAALPVCISAAAATIITYKVEVTSESKASGWNSARLELHYKDRSGNKTSDTWDIKNDISNGNNVVKTVKRYETDKVPYMIRLYLDFGGGFTIRTHMKDVRQKTAAQSALRTLRLPEQSASLITAPLTTVRRRITEERIIISAEAIFQPTG